MNININTINININNSNNASNNTQSLSEHEQIELNYNNWVQSAQPALNEITKEYINQDNNKPFRRCYEEHDPIRKQLPSYWYIREDGLLISFKHRNKLLNVPIVVNINKYMDRPSYPITVKAETKKGYSTKQITDYDLVTIVWHSDRIYGQARTLLSDSIHNLGMRELNKDKAHGHHYADKSDNSKVIVIDTKTHDFLHHAPCTDKAEGQQEQKLIQELQTVAEQEQNKFTVMYKGEDAEQGVINATNNITLSEQALNDLQAIFQALNIKIN